MNWISLDIRREARRSGAGSVLGSLASSGQHNHSNNPSDGDWKQCDSRTFGAAFSLRVGAGVSDRSCQLQPSPTMLNEEPADPPLVVPNSLFRFVEGRFHRLCERCDFAQLHDAIDRRLAT